MKNNFNQSIENTLKKTEYLQRDDCGIHAPISKYLNENRLSLINIFHGSGDIVFKDVVTGGNPCLKSFAFYLADLVDEDMLAQHVLRALLQPQGWGNMGNGDAVIETAEKQIIEFGKVEKAESLEEISQAAVNGYVAVFFEGCSRSLIIDLEKRETRSIPTPQIEASVFGPRQALVENVKTNLSLIRNIIRSPRLIVEKYTSRQGVKTPVYLLYLSGVVNTSVLEKIHNRLDAMQTELILDSTSIKELISDKRSFPFNTIGVTERPDKIAAKIMEGKIALLADGSPLALIAPYLFIEEFHNIEDYYTPPFFASFSRFVRIASFLITLYIVPVYVAMATFHQEMFPLTLLITATASREGIPFPTFVEALIMTFIFDILREGGIRAPRPVGQTISFIGALIIGTAAVDAGIISAPMVIIIALTGITALLNYPLKNMIILSRLVLLVSGAFFGFFGIAIISIVILIRLCSIDSFGVPYLSPVAPLNKAGFIKDTFLRFPLKLLSYFSGPSNQ